MFNAIVRKTVRDGFSSLSQGNYEAVIRLFLPNARFHFMGDHAMGADLYTREGARRWFQRMLRLFPGIQFEVKHVAVSGTPWATTVVTELGIRASLPGGQPYENSALQVLRLRWGRVVEDIVVEDTQRLVTALGQIAAHGNTEASAGPLVDQGALGTKQARATSY